MASPTIPCPACGKPNPQGTPYCGYCGKQLSGAPQQPQKTIMGYALPANLGQPGGPGGRPAPGQMPSPLPPPPAGPPAYGQPAQPPPPYGAPPQGPPGYGPPPQPPAYGAPPQPYGAPPQPPAYGAPPQPPAYGAPPQPPAYGAPPQPPAYGAPPQPPPAYGAPQQPPAYGAAPQQPQYPPQQPQYAPQQPQYAPQQPQYAPAAAALAKIPQSAPGTLFGIPFSLMKDQDFLNKVLRLSAIALVVSRFIPMSIVGGQVIWVWTVSGWFSGFILPIIAAAVYGAVSFAPRHIQEKIPPVVLQWGPFVVAYLGSSLGGVVGGGVPGAGGGMAMLGYLYPLLVFGLVVRLQDEDDMIARGFIALGALGALGAMLSSLGYIFNFGFPGNFLGKIFIIIHNIAMFAVLLVATASVIFAIPTKWVPALAGFQGFAPLATAVLIVWLPVQATLVTLALVLGGAGVMNILILPHALIMQVGFLGVLLLTAPAAFGVLKNMLQKAGVSTSASAYTGGGAAAAPPPPTAGVPVEQRLAELDAAWHRGGMTPEEYQQRRAAILSGR